MYFTAYLQIDNFYLKKYATNEITVKAESKITRLAQPSNTAPSQHADELVPVALCCEVCAWLFCIQWNTYKISRRLESSKHALPLGRQEKRKSAQSYLSSMPPPHFGCMDMTQHPREQAQEPKIHRRRARYSGPANRISRKCRRDRIHLSPLHFYKENLSHGSNWNRCFCTVGHARYGFFADHKCRRVVYDERCKPLRSFPAKSPYMFTKYFYARVQALCVHAFLEHQRPTVIHTYETSWWLTRSRDFWKK